MPTRRGWQRCGRGARQRNREPLQRRLKTCALQPYFCLLRKGSFAPGTRAAAPTSCRPAARPKERPTPSRARASRCAAAAQPGRGPCAGGDDPRRQEGYCGDCPAAAGASGRRWLCLHQRRHRCVGGWPMHAGGWDACAAAMHCCLLSDMPSPAAGPTHDDITCAPWARRALACHCSEPCSSAWGGQEAPAQPACCTAALLAYRAPHARLHTLPPARR